MKFLKYDTINAATLVLIVISIIFDNVWICRLAVVSVLLLCIILSKSDKHSIVNPMLLFAVTPLSLLVYKNFGDMYMVDLTHRTWVIAIINMYAFILSYKLTPAVKHSSYIQSNVNVVSLEIQAVLFYLISMLAVVIHPLQSILWIFSIPAIVCALQTRKKLMIAFVIAIFLISALGVTSKTAMLTYCMAFILCFEKYYATTDKSKKAVKWVLLTGVTFMLFAFSFANKDRGHIDVDESLEVYSDRGMEWNYSSSLFMPYMYLTNGWTNLQYVMETQDNRTYGLWTAKPLLGYLQFENNFKKEYEIETYSTFNTCSYMTYGFKDFGYWLSVLMSIFLGFFVKRVYSRSQISSSPYDLASYILVAQATFELFFSNHFFTQSYPFTVVILMAIVKVFTERKRVEL